MPTYWGDLHGHSQLSDGRRSPDEYYTFARDQAELDFCALTDHLDHVAGSRAGLMPEESWERIKETTARFDEAGRFVTLMGFERSVPSWDGRTPGNLCAYYPGGGGALPRPKHAQRDWLRPRAVDFEAEMKELWGTLEGAKCLTAVVHCGSARQGYTWPHAPRQFAPDLVEVYSKWGSSETPASPFPIIDGVGHGPRPKGSVHAALAAGFQLGFIAGSETHLGRPGSNQWESDWANAARYDKSGLTAVYAEELSRKAIFEALKKRHCYATTCERIELSFAINDGVMGDVLPAAGPLRVRVRVQGTRPIKRAEVFCNGQIIRHKIGGREEFELNFDEDTPAEPTWYYVRVTQSGEDYAWSSPIWVMPQAD